MSVFEEMEMEDGKSNSSSEGPGFTESADESVFFRYEGQVSRW